MRNLLLALLLANILYFMYERFVEEPREYGVAVVEESQLGPTLELAEAPVTGSAGADSKEPADAAADGEAIAGDEVVAEEPASRNLSAVAGRSCVTVGPFMSGSEANNALGEIEDDGLRAALRATDGEVFVGHWVHITNIESRADANTMIEALKEGGLGDSYLTGTAEEGYKISLGLFGEMERAERIELQAKSLGLPAVIEPRMRDAKVFYVDVGLPPGRGAGRMLRKYGEDLVLLRGQATCPGNG